MVTVGFDQYTDSCFCRKPQPDRASPCGFKWPDGAVCLTRPGASVHDQPEGHHPHVATTCLTCGHPMDGMVVRISAARTALSTPATPAPAPEQPHRLDGPRLRCARCHMTWPCPAAILSPEPDR